MVELILKNEVYAIIGVAIEVHRILGPGFLEPVYQEAFEVESTQRGLAYKAQQVLEICYKEHRLKKQYIADMVFFDQIIVELKALDRLSGREQAQIINYLKATGMKVGVLINFGSHPSLNGNALFIEP